ncbi:MAG: helix-turn-helix transcriptional regulator [Planctomycetes bacterium]|nr:helix-turn-helix transcriptional regulator [Planctomycetota bacterium]
MSKHATFTDRVRQAILSSGVSRYALSKVVGVSQAALSRFVNGHCGIASETLDAVADALGFQLVVDRSKATLRPASAGATRRRK